MTVDEAVDVLEASVDYRDGHIYHDGDANDAIDALPVNTGYVWTLIEKSASDGTVNWTKVRNTLLMDAVNA